MCNEIGETCELITTATQVCTPAEILSAKDAMTSKVAQIMKQYQEYNLDPCRSDLVADMLDTAEMIEKISMFGIVIGGSHPSKTQTDLYVPGAVAKKEKKVTVSTFDVNGRPYSHG